MVSFVLVGVFLLLAGCQPVGGVDINKVMTNSANVTSSQSKQTMTIELTRDLAAVLSPEEQKMLDLFGTVKLNLTEVKMQDVQTVSVKGDFEYKNGLIPFTLTTDNQQFVIQIEGAKKPIVIGNSAALQDTEGLSEELVAQLEQLQSKAVEVAPSLVSFFVTHMPNPSKISVDNATETVNGESLALKKIHAEVNGSELPQLVKGFLTGILEDEAGLKEFIGQLYDLYVPIIKAAIKEESAQDDPMANEFMPFLENKTLAVEFVHTFLKENLTTLLASYDESLKDLLANGGKEFLNENQTLKTDIYVDQDMMIRKQSMELSLLLPNSATTGIKNVKITSDQELWNINKPVTADKIDTSGGVVELSDDTSGLNPSRLVAALDKNSQLYKLLKEDLNITKKEIRMSMNDAAADPALTTKPYNNEGTVMVPVRFVSEQLDADVKWNAELRQVTITDPLSGNVVVLTIDSKQATVNGIAKTLEKEAVLVEGTTFIPVRFVSESLGADVKWEQDTQTVIITRD